MPCYNISSFFAVGVDQLLKTIERSDESQLSVQRAFFDLLTKLSRLSDFRPACEKFVDVAKATNPPDPAKAEERIRYARETMHKCLGAEEAYHLQDNPEYKGRLHASNQWVPKSARVSISPPPLKRQRHERPLPLTLEQSEQRKTVENPSHISQQSSPVVFQEESARVSISSPPTERQRHERPPPLTLEQLEQRMNEAVETALHDSEHSSLIVLEQRASEKPNPSGRDKYQLGPTARASVSPPPRQPPQIEKRKAEAVDNPRPRYPPAYSRDSTEEPPDENEPSGKFSTRRPADTWYLYQNEWFNEIACQDVAMHTWHDGTVVCDCWPPIAARSEMVIHEGDGKEYKVYMCHTDKCEYVCTADWQDFIQEFRGWAKKASDKEWKSFMGICRYKFNSRQRYRKRLQKRAEFKAERARKEREYNDELKRRMLRDQREAGNHLDTH